MVCQTWRGSCLVCAYWRIFGHCNKIKRSLRKLKWSEQSNEVTTDLRCIMTELKKFYSELYTPRSLKTETECMDYLHSLNLPKLSNDDRLSCEGKLTLQECWEA